MSDQSLPTDVSSDSVGNAPVISSVIPLGTTQAEAPDSATVAEDAGRRAVPSGRKRQFVTTVGSSFGIVFLQLGQGILLARLLGPEGRGEYATAVFYVQFLLYIGLFGGLEVVCRHATKLSGEPAERLRRGALRLSLVTGSVTAGVVVLLSAAAMPASKHPLIPLAALCAISVVGQHVMLIMTAVDRGAGRFGIYNVRRLIAAAAFPLLLGGAACFMTMTVTWACVWFVVASLISVLVCLVGVRRPIRGPAGPPVRQLVRESRPYGLSMLASDMFERLDLLLVLWLAPFEQQGYYAAMVPVVYPLIIIPNTLGMFLFNAAAGRRFQVGDVHRVLASSLAVQTVVTIVFLGLIGWVVEWVYGVSFLPAVPYALWLAPASAIRGIAQGLDSYLKGRGRPMAPVAARLASAVVLLVAAAMLYPSQGVLGIAMAAVLAQGFGLVWLAAIMYADCRQTESGGLAS